MHRGIFVRFMEFMKFVGLHASWSKSSHARGSRRLGFVVVASAFVASTLASRPLSGQMPTADQISRLLETQPALLLQLQQEVAASGFTLDQIHAKLRDAGYPENMLDPYLGGTARQGSLGPVSPSQDITDAASGLSVSDTSNAAILRGLMRAQAARVAGLSMPTAISAATASPNPLSQLDWLGLTSGADSGGARQARRPRSLFSTLFRPRMARDDSGFTVFGLDVFLGSTTQFDPNLAGPVDASYRIGAGDRIVLIITGDAERAYTLDVTREGFVIIPGVGELPVGNLTLGELEALLYTRLGKVYSGLRRGPDATTHFSITLARLHTNQVFVLGDVAQPGSYHVSSAGTALAALYAAGGPAITGSMRRIEIRRGDHVVDTLDLYDYLLRADASRDLRLQSGDVVFVPVHGPRVRVYGEVVRPATYELRPGETLADLLRDAGGFTAEASRRRVQISRILEPTKRDTTDRARIVIDVASPQLATGTGPAYPMEPGDVVRVFPVSDRVMRQVAVEGNVWTPGVVGFTSGMRLSDAVRMAGGIKPDTYLGQVLVSRLRPSDSVRVQLRTSFSDSTGRALNDLVLQQDDEITVFSMADFRPAEYVEISGAVQHPGRFPYHEAMTLRDLVLLAGGLAERASVREAEVVRRAASATGGGASTGRLASSQRVPLDSSYVLASHPDMDGGLRQAGEPVSPRTAIAPEFVLDPYDNVLIMSQPDWEAPKRVVVDGEVQSPGNYTLLSKDERLSDVLHRAGGLTKAAYPGGIVLVRAQNKVGRIDVDLPAVLEHPHGQEDPLLQDGDSIHLPRFSNVVQVEGAVNAPRAVTYVPGADINYYVRAAGGTAHGADAHQAYVTQPDGHVESVVVRRMWPDAIPTPLAGSTVTVPDADKQSSFDAASRYIALSQFVSSLVALIAILHH